MVTSGGGAANVNMWLPVDVSGKIKFWVRFHPKCIASDISKEKVLAYEYANKSPIANVKVNTMAMCVKLPQTPAFIQCSNAKITDEIITAFVWPSLLIRM